MPVNVEKKTSVITIPFRLIESNISGFKSAVREMINTAPEIIYIDCSTLEQVISRHINLIWESRSACMEADIGMELINITPGLQRILEILDIKEIFVEETSNDEINLWTANIIPDKTEINKHLENLDKFLAGFNIPPLTVFEVKTLFYEIVTNICLYAGLQMDELFEVEVVCSEQNIRLQFTDTGTSFDPTAIPVGYSPAESIKNAQKRGFGLVMINKMSDNIIYSRKNGSTNILTIEKKWK